MQEDTCTYTGIFGALLSLACVFQNLVYFRTFDHIVPAIMLGVFLFSTTCFVMLAMQRFQAPVMLIVSAALVLCTEMVLTLTAVFSLLVLLLFLYNVTLVIVLYVDQLPARLKQRALAMKAEEDNWKGLL